MDHPGLTMGDVTTSDGVTLRYLEAGSAAPLLMIPGMENPQKFNRIVADFIG
jgi:hypothetical protein